MIFVVFICCSIFIVGDHRSAETPVLTPLHILFLREHNRIANIFIQQTSWNADRVFQETRKIVNAILQNIVYREFLPLLLGSFHMNSYGLRVKPWGHDTIYFDGINPGTINSFGAAAYRMGHSLVRNKIRHANMNFNTVQTYRTKDTYFKTFSTFFPFNRGADRYTRWMSSEVKAGSDRFLVDDVRDNLFPTEINGKKVALDLAALNIQRGRDHGLPGYNAFRERCGLKKATHFGTGPNGLTDHTPGVAQNLQELYK